MTIKLFTSKKTLATALAALAAGVFTSLAQAQDQGLGSYVGTINVSGTLVEPRGSYRAKVKVSLPISKIDDDSIEAEFLAGEAPNATALVTDWEFSHTDKFADSGGQFNSYSCKLQGSAEVPMSVTGVLNVDLSANTYSFSVSLLSTKELEFDCNQSRSGPYKSKEGISLYAGTGAPGMQSEHPLPFTDAARLTENNTLTVKDGASGNFGPIIQEWDLRRTP